jgi:hypothetical protein
MATWTEDQLARIGAADELRISSRRPDGSLRPYITIWVVRVGDELFVRSAYGRDNPWFRRALAAGVGRIQAGGVERDVSFDEPDPAVDVAVTAVFHAKYDRYGQQYVGPVVSDEAARSTLRLTAA